MGSWCVRVEVPLSITAPNVLASLEGFTFRQSSSFKHSTQILNIVPGDFTHDGTLDLLVMGRSSQSSSQDMKLYVGNKDGFGVYSRRLVVFYN